MAKLGPQAKSCNERLLYMFTGHDGGNSFCNWRFQIVEASHDPALAEELDKLFYKLNKLLEYCGAKDGRLEGS